MENIVDPILEIKDVSISYDKNVTAVKNVSACVERNTITAIMGPSGCGKSTLLRAVNRMHELYKNITVTGEILLNGENILTRDPIEVRRNIGMVFQRPNPFPTMSIYDNVLAGYTLNGISLSKHKRDDLVGETLRCIAEIEADPRTLLEALPDVLDELYGTSRIRKIGLSLPDEEQMRGLISEATFLCLEKLGAFTDAEPDSEAH